MKKVVAVAGGFDPLHPGHKRHMEAAKLLGDYLVVIVSSDADMIRKKGYCYQPLEWRMELIKPYPFVDEVIPSVDKDGTVAETLRILRPAIFAKGGDRTPGTMPLSEIKVCQEIGCQIVYGVGDTRDENGDWVSSSRSMAKVRGS